MRGIAITIMVLMVVSSLSACNTKLGRAFEALQPGDDSGVNIDLQDLKVCCIYLDENNNTKNCMVLQKYSCDYCADQCGNQTNSLLG